MSETPDPYAAAAEFVGCTLEPVADRIIVQQDSAAAKSEGGVLLSAGAQEKPMRGTVVAVGRGRTNEYGELVPMYSKAGDRVLFAPFCGSRVEFEGEELLIMREEDVLAFDRSALPEGTAT